MTLQERLLRLGDESTMHRLPRIGQPHREQERLGLHPPQDHPQIGEVDLGLTAGFMGLRHTAFCHTPTGLSGDLRAPFRDIVPDRRVRNTLCCLLIHQPGQHPPGGMPLLPRRVQIRFQPLIDDRFVFLQPAGHPHRRLPCRRQRRRQRLPHRPAVHMMPIRQLPDRQALHPRIPADRSEQLHPRLHPWPLQQVQHRHRSGSPSTGATSNRHNKPGVSRWGQIKPGGFQRSSQRCGCWWVLKW